MVARRTLITTLAVLTYVIGGSVASIQSFASPDASAGVAFLLVALALLLLAAFAAGSWWSLGLPFVPVIPVAVWDEATCHDDLFEFCGLAPVGLALLAVFLGVPAAAIATSLSPRLRRG